MTHAILQQNRQIFVNFFGSCKELQAQSARMLMEPVTVQMFKVAIATKPALSPPPANRNSPPPPPPPGGAHSTAVKAYHAVCSSSSISGCVPHCNATTHGFELLATIDGSDTKFSCSVAHGLRGPWRCRWTSRREEARR